MKQWFFLSIGLLFSGMVCGQVPAIEWQVSPGGSEWDEATSIQQTSDEGYIVVGYSLSDDGDVSFNHGSADIWVVKLDVAGNLEWERSLGGSGWDEASSVEQTFDGGYIIAGLSSSSDGDVTQNRGDDDVWVVKLDQAGNLEWEKSLGGSDAEFAHSIQQTEDEGYILAGYTWSEDGDVSVNHGSTDAWIVKLDAEGELQWERTLGGSDSDYAHSIQQTEDGGYIIAGYTWSDDGDVSENLGKSDCWIVKLDANGELRWERTFGGSNMDIAMSVRQTTDHGYIFAGITTSEDGDVTDKNWGQDAWIVKLDTEGELQWERTLGGNDDDGAYSIRQTDDGGYIAAGFSSSEDGDLTENLGERDAWLIRLDASGNLLWQKSLGGSEEDGASAIRQTADGGYIMSGFSSSGNDHHHVRHSLGMMNYWVVKLGYPSSATELPDFSTSVSVFPNPSSGDILWIETGDAVRFSPGETIRFSLYSASGILMKQFTPLAQDSRFYIRAGDLPAGFYFARIDWGKGYAMKKLILK